MLNNYAVTLTSLATFLWLHAPAGAEREVARLKAQLVAGEVPSYFSLEFRPTQDVSCQLYVNLRGRGKEYGATRVEDAEGNVWYAHTVECGVSWPSWGSGSVEVCQRRLALMTEVTRFAAEVERAFSAEFYQLTMTKAERETHVLEVATKANLAAAKAVVLANAKGMKLGQSKSVGCSDSIKAFGILDVERSEGGRTFKYRAGLECASLMTIQRVG